MLREEIANLFAGTFDMSCKKMEKRIDKKKGLSSIAPTGPVNCLIRAASSISAYHLCAGYFRSTPGGLQFSGQFGFFDLT